MGGTDATKKSERSTCFQVTLTSMRAVKVLAAWGRGFTVPSLESIFMFFMQIHQNAVNKIRGLYNQGRVPYS